MEIILMYILFIIVASLVGGAFGGMFEIILWIGNCAARKNDRVTKYMTATESRKRRTGA